jgi:hypothetical protein
MLRIGFDRIGVRSEAPPERPIVGICPIDGAAGVFRRTTLMCPRCGRVLGGI